MNKEIRIAKIEEIIDNKNKIPIGRIEIPWEDELEPMDLYKIPLEYLVYNKYNGRILSRTKSLEAQDRKIDPESEEGKKTIETLLFDSKPDRNKKTLESIIAHGQQKPGIVTRDGIIIDGNRRAMLLSRSKKYDFFKAVILPVTLDEDPLGIEELETTYQMGEDEKLGYNPIEKYLKAKGLYQKLAGKPFSRDKDSDKIAIRKISDWMGESKTTILDYLRVMETMDDYLDYLSYQGIYTQLDGREDQSINLTQWINNYYGEKSAKAFPGYTDDDVDELKSIAFDYIRLKYEGKKFRYLGKGQRPNHFFGDKKIWVSFKDRHLNFVDSITEDEINLNSQNLTAHLNDRDKRYADQVFKELDDNVDTHYQELRYRQAEDEPQKLISNAKRALKAINQGHNSFSSPEVGNELETVSNFVDTMLPRNSALSVLLRIEKLLNTIDLAKSQDNRDALEEKAKDIQRQIYKLTKSIKKMD